MSPALPSHLGEKELELKQTINLLSSSQDTKQLILQLFFDYFKTVLSPIARVKESWCCHQMSPKIVSQEDEEFIYLPFKR